MSMLSDTTKAQYTCEVQERVHPAVSGLHIYDPPVSFSSFSGGRTWDSCGSVVRAVIKETIQFPVPGSSWLCAAVEQQFPIGNPKV